jgi:hypothetical protein
VKLVVEIRDLPPGRTKSHAVANYVRALITNQALRRDLAEAAVEVARCKKVSASPVQGEALMAGAHALCEELGIELDISIATAPDGNR